MTEQAATEKFQSKPAWKTEQIFAHPISLFAKEIHSEGLVR